jgi:putative SOS response-associated peptidase YedK
VCGRYTLATPSPADLRARFPVGEEVEIKPRYNVAPGDDVLAITTDKEGAPRGELLRWGLVPSWAQSPDTGLTIINARVETVAERPAFRRAFERLRCLIVADGFYEWSHRDAGPKQAFHITRSDREPFAFAGLWSIWYGEEDRKLRSCAILTTAPNEAVSPLHDRMPVILAPQAESEWLDPATPQPRLYELLAGLKSSDTAVGPVGPAVNDARYDGPECLAPAPESGLSALHSGQPTLF